VGVKFRIETQDTYSIVKEKIAEGKTMCLRPNRRIHWSGRRVI
jgi:hypothetical protein